MQLTQMQLQMNRLNVTIVPETWKRKIGTTIQLFPQQYIVRCRHVVVIAHT
jgi:hypothetical protein